MQVGGRVNFTPAYDHQKMKPIAEQVTGGHMDPSRPSPGSSHGGGGMGGGAVGGGFAPPQQLYQQQQQQQHVEEYSRLQCVPLAHATRHRQHLQLAIICAHTYRC